MFPDYPNSMAMRWELKVKSAGLHLSLKKYKRVWTTIGRITNKPGFTPGMSFSISYFSFALQTYTCCSLWLWRPFHTTVTRTQSRDLRNGHLTPTIQSVAPSQLGTPNIWAQLFGPNQGLCKGYWLVGRFYFIASDAGNLEIDFRIRVTVIRFTGAWSWI